MITFYTHSAYIVPGIDDETPTATGRRCFGYTGILTVRSAYAALVREARRTFRATEQYGGKVGLQQAIDAAARMLGIDPDPASHRGQVASALDSAAEWRKRGPRWYDTARTNVAHARDLRIGKHAAAWTHLP